MEGAVSSLQEQIDLLVARVDTMEERVGANEVAITTLQDQNEALRILIQDNLIDITTIEAEILFLQQSNEDLGGMIAANTGDIVVLQAELDANSDMVATLQGSILMIQSNIISFDDSLQVQIDNNLDLINLLQDEIDIIDEQLLSKQNLVNGMCLDGSAIQQILEDGSVVCEGVTSSSGQLQSTYMQQVVWMYAGQQVSSYLRCPSGYIAINSGYTTVSNIEFLHKYVANDGATIFAKNNNTYGTTFVHIATCIKIN